MKIAVMNTHAGAPETLASTAFIGALNDGLMRVGITTRTIGLTSVESTWRPESLAPFDTSAPWMSAPAARLVDSFAAAALGIFDTDPTCPDARISEPNDWYFELLLERELRAFAGAERDLAVMMYPRSFALLGTVVRITRRCGWKLIVISTEALTDLQIDPTTRDAYIRCVAHHADGVWVLSEHLAAFWRGHDVSAERIVLSPPAVRESFFELSDPPREESAIYIGNLQHREVDYLIHIAEQVRMHVPSFRLTIFGDTSDDRRHELEAAIVARNLETVVAIEPPVSPSEVSTILRAADVLLLPRARGEFSDAGFPNKLGEYLSTGRPVVVTAVGDIPRYLVDGESAFLVAPDDTDAFTAALVRALLDDTLADRIGAGGQSVARKLSASSVVAERLVTFIGGLPKPKVEPTTLAVRLARASRVTSAVRVLFHPHLIRALHQMRHTRTGHTRVVAAKMLIVRVLHALGGRQPPK